MMTIAIVGMVAMFFIGRYWSAVEDGPLDRLDQMVDDHFDDGDIEDEGGSE